MSSFDLRMDDKVVLVTGAAHGIGRALCEGLAEAGAIVVLVDVDEPTGSAVAEALTDRGHQVTFTRADVAAEADANRLAVEVRDRFGRLDGLVNNAAVDGAPPAVPLLELSAADYDRVMEVNVKGMWLMARALAPLLESSSGGVVNIGSIGAFLVSPGYLPYVVSKNAVIGLTKSLAHELGPRGVRVNSLAPGSTATASVARSVPPDVVESIVAAQCVKQRMQPHDLVGALLFLLSDASRFVTGQTLVVDGGVVMLP